MLPRDSPFSRKPPQKKVHYPATPGRMSNCKKGFFFAFAEDNPCRNKDGSRDRYLPIISGDEGEEFIHVAHSQPLRVNLHRRLHFLGIKKIPDSLGHPPARGPGE